MVGNFVCSCKDTAGKLQWNSLATGSALRQIGVSYKRTQGKGVRADVGWETPPPPSSTSLVYLPLASHVVHESAMREVWCLSSPRALLNEKPADTKSRYFRFVAQRRSQAPTLGKQQTGLPNNTRGGNNHRSGIYSYKSSLNNVCILHNRVNLHLHKRNFREGHNLGLLSELNICQNIDQLLMSSVIRTSTSHNQSLFFFFEPTAEQECALVLDVVPE